VRVKSSQRNFRNGVGCRGEGTELTLGGCEPTPHDREVLIISKGPIRHEKEKERAEPSEGEGVVNFSRGAGDSPKGFLMGTDEGKRLKSYKNRELCPLMRKGKKIPLLWQVKVPQIKNSTYPGKF